MTGVQTCALPIYVGGGEHGGDTSRQCGAARLDAGDPGIGMRAAQDIGVELPRPVDVVGVGPLAGQEPVILAPANWFADRRRAAQSISHGRYSAATPWGLAGGVSPRITAAPSAIASTMLW